MGSDRVYYDDIVPFDRDTLLVRETVMDSFDDDISCDQFSIAFGTPVECQPPNPIRFY